MTQCNVRGCTNEATHTWSGHPTCDDCGTPKQKPWNQPFAVDCREVLRKYIRLVGEMEGITFIDHRPNGKPSYFTNNEWEFLKEQDYAALKYASKMIETELHED